MHSRNPSPSLSAEADATAILTLAITGHRRLPDPAGVVQALRNVLAGLTAATAGGSSRRT